MNVALITAYCFSQMNVSRQVPSLLLVLHLVLHLSSALVEGRDSSLFARMATGLIQAQPPNALLIRTAELVKTPETEPALKFLRQQSKQPV